MILLAENLITLKQPTNKAFGYLTNMENYGDWFPGVVSITSANQQAHGTQGKQYHEILILPEGEKQLVIEVKDCEIDHRFYTEGSLAPLYPAMEMIFTSISPTRTELNLRYYSRSTELTPESEIIQAIQQDLSERIKIAESHLQQRCLF